jgi:6-pyruvoyl tetrahydropterin synthase/QueD family protein
MHPPGEFRVSVSKDYLVFASAHFITFAGHRCEGLHGHNYRASVTVEGELNEESWFVFDFVELKRIMRRLCDEIDHLVLLPLKSSRVQVTEEMLAELLTTRLRTEFDMVGARAVTAIEMEVEENFGQSATYRLSLR